MRSLDTERFCSNLEWLYGNGRQIAPRQATL